MKPENFANWTSNDRTCAFSKLLREDGKLIYALLVADATVSPGDHYYGTCTCFDGCIKIADKELGESEQSFFMSVTNGEDQPSKAVAITSEVVTFEKFKEVFLNGAPEEGSNFSALVNPDQVYVTMTFTQW